MHVKLQRMLKGVGFRRYIILGLFSALCVWSHPTQSAAEESHPGIGLESIYSEAVIAYNTKQTDKALKILDDLLKVAPGHLEGLELKALVLNSKGDDEKSLEVYQELIKLKPEEQRGPYYFESAVILNRLKKSQQAAAYFEKAIEENFNPAASHLFLGMITFNSGNFAGAEEHFQFVSKRGTPELQIVSHYYMGLIDFKNSFGSGGTSEMTKARAMAKAMPDNKTAADIHAAADKILEPFNQGQFYANVSVLGQYDSNVLLIPTGTVSSAQSSGKATGKVNILGGFGYLSAPLGLIQWVPSYRFAYNKNFNSDSRNYEFFTNTPSLVININPLSLTTGGLRLEANLIFQNQPQDPLDTKGSYIFRKYSLGEEIAPFIRYQASRKLQLNFEFSIRPQTNYSEAGLSGPDYSPRFSLKGETSSPYLNPGGNLSYEIYKAQDLNLAYNAWDAGLFNSAKLSASDTLTLSFDYISTKYSDASIARSDNNITAHLSALHTLSTRWSILGDTSYVNNVSTVPASYSYNRFLIGAGIACSI